MRGICPSPSIEELSTNKEFSHRHIGPNDHEVREMLTDLGLGNIDDLIEKVIPENIRTKESFASLGHGISEYQMLLKARNILGKNKVYKSLIGMGYYNCITPSVILRNVFENPIWYTAYTPYQPEISQGRLEALLNFQTVITDLTQMEIANASLLDEGTACAEAVSMAFAQAKNKNVNAFLVSPRLHPQSIEVLRTRSESLGLKMIIESPEDYQFRTPVFAVILQYPTTEGSVIDYSNLTDRCHREDALVIVAADLLALTLIKPPGEWGADIVVGNSQRFGVPLGYGGPHAAYLATKDTFKRVMPGRLIGVSVDSNGRPALRLALQTREQHIRREKATSNICTAQVLLANMASMYAVYHGPEGLKKIAQRIWRLTAIMAEGLRQLGFENENPIFFDTIKISKESIENKTNQIIAAAKELKINFRVYDDQSIGISLDETCDLNLVNDIWRAFNLGDQINFNVNTIDSQISLVFPENLLRTSKYLTHSVFSDHHSETEMMRYIHHLQNKDITLTHSMIPLGSCTMKLNATTELMPISWPEVSQLHPFAPISQAEGYIEMFKDLEDQLKIISGFPGVCLQPNAGSQGEYAGLLVIKKYLKSIGQAQRDLCLIPSSAHGTNPASAVMAGFQVIVIKCDDLGNVDVEDLKLKAEEHADQLGCLMITYPSTHGVFEESISRICEIIHSKGGQVYMDGANMNALVGWCRPGEFGPDVLHLNLHKTFSIPHGGGGPGVGPIGVAQHLKNFLPQPHLIFEDRSGQRIGTITSAPWGSASILPISWSYINLMGAQGLQAATVISILNANYIAKKLDSYFPVLYKGKNGFVAHECIIDLRPLKKTSGIDGVDVAKRLMDYGFHAPTMSFPVPGTLMIEPTESESKLELDRFIDAMISIRKEIESIELGQSDRDDNVLKNSPHTIQDLISGEWKHPYSREQAVFPLPYLKKNKYWPPVGRVDNAHGDRNLICTCPSLESYSV